MPAKIDSRSFNYAKQADKYLSLATNDKKQFSFDPSDTPDSGSNDDTAQSIWRDISGNPDAVSSYIICLIAKLISLDSGQGLRPLPEVYKDITELQVDISKYKAWCNKEKPLPPPLKTKAVRLQHFILSTIYFLKQFYGFSANIQMRNMYLRWNIARNQIASTFEVELLSSFTAIGSKDIRDSITSPFLSPEINEERLVRELINDCYHHRRSFFGSLPSVTCKLTINKAVSTSLSYIRLKDLLSRSPGLLKFAMDQISSLLQGVSQTQDYGEREVLLPLLHLMKECLTMMVDVDYNSLYKLLMPFYTWPSSHSETVKEVLGILLLERKVKGTLYRRTILREHQLDLNLTINRPKTDTVVMLIDTSSPGNYGNNLYKSMIYHQEKPPTLLIKRLLLCSVFHSLSEESKETDITQIETTICKLSEESLTSFCEEGIDMAEQAVAMENIEEAEEFLKTETKELYKKLLATIEEIPTDEQEGSPNDKETIPTSFVLPPPYIPVYELNQSHFSSLVDKLQDILTRLQRGNEGSAYPSVNVDSFVTSYPSTSSTAGFHGNTSHNSLASSTGSYSVDEYSSNRKSSTDLSYLGNDVGTTQNGIHRSVSPTVKSDPGMSQLINRPGTTGDSPSSKKGLGYTTKSLSLQITSGPSEGEGFGDVGSQDSDKDTSDTCSSKASEEIVSRISVDSSSTPSRKLERRNTDSFTSSSRRNLSALRGSLYPNQIVSPTSSICSINIGSGSRGSVKQRANPTGSGTFRQRRATISSAVPKKLKGRLRKVRMLLAGDDMCLSNAAKAYSHLRIKEPNLFNNLDIEFLYIPLSKAVIGGSEQPSSSQGGSVDHPEPTTDTRNNECGHDVMIGQYLAHTDSWYEQNVMLAVHNSLRLLLNDSNYMPRSFSMLEGLDTRWLPLPTPSRVIVNIAANFLREALHSIHSKIFRVKMTLRSDKAAKGFENRESFMFHRIDIQRLTGKKGTPKPYEASVALTELSLDNSFIKSALIQMNNVWIIRGSNIPHPWDLGVPNPESECFELTVVKILSEGGMLSSTKHRVQEELQHHVYEMVVESGKEKPLSVIIDDDSSAITENVIRVEVSPAYIDQAIAGSNLRRTERQERQMTFPLMTFWPVDL